MMKFRFNVYDYMIIILIVVAIAGVYTTGLYHLRQLVIVPSVAAILDYAIKFYRFKARKFPKSAVISGLLVAMVIEATLPLLIAAAFIAILSKHIIAWKAGNIFNPAALAIIVTGFFGAGATWWAASTPLVLLGVFVTYKIRKVVLAASFLTVYFALSIAITAGFSIQYFYNLYALFFALFMLIEPRTSAHTRKAMIVFGVSAAVLALSMQFIPLPMVPVDFLLSSLLVMNIFTPFLDKKLK
jgi:Na+-translocating ferredoxin:NAD+ oxidoreductase RnfD subunit